MSHRDFYTSQAQRRKTINGGVGAGANSHQMAAQGSKIAATSSELLEHPANVGGVAGYSSSRTPVAINMSDRRKIAAGFEAHGNHH